MMSATPSFIISCPAGIPERNEYWKLQAEFHPEREMPAEYQVKYA